MNATSTGVRPNGRTEAWLLAALVGIAAVAVVVYAAFHPEHEASALALGVLVAASAFDALNGTIPLLLLLAAVAISGASAAIDHRIPWLALGTLPIGYSAAKTRETAIGWGDVLALIVLAVALPFQAAIAAIIVGASASLLSTTIFTFLSGSRAGRMTPFLALAGAIMLWVVVR